VPQMRERLFVTGLDARLGLIPMFPKRTHSLQLPVGYTTSRTGRPDYIPVLPPSNHYVSDRGGSHWGSAAAHFPSERP
jgi:hypothetical protein